MTPYDEFQKDYITVGLAPVNPSQIVGEYVPPTPEPTPEPTPSPTPIPQPANDSSQSDNSTVPVPDPGNDTAPADNTTVTPVIIPVSPNESSEKSTFMEKNGLYLIIAGAALLLIIVVIVVCCMRKNKKDDYRDKAYSIVEDEHKVSSTSI